MQFPDPICVISRNTPRLIFTVSSVYHFIYYTSCDWLLQIFNSYVPRLNSRYERSRTNLNRRALVNIMCHNFNSICETCDINEISCSILNNSFRVSFLFFLLYHHFLYDIFFYRVAKAKKKSNQVFSNLPTCQFWFGILIEVKVKHIERLAFWNFLSLFTLIFYWYLCCAVSPYKA